MFNYLFQLLFSLVTTNGCPYAHKNIKKLIKSYKTLQMFCCHSRDSCMEKKPLTIRTRSIPHHVKMGFYLHVVRAGAIATLSSRRSEIYPLSYMRG